MHMGFDILRHRATLNQQRELFLLNFRAEIESFDQIDKFFPRWAAFLPPATGKDAFTLAPFLQIMHRQARQAFESLAAFQSGPAWAALRPLLEAPLIMGKWLDDSQNAVIWMSRNAGKKARKAYQDAYSGDNLKPRCLPDADAIRLVLARITDDFIQTQARYYTRPVAFQPAHSKPAAADAPDDPADHRAHLYAALHLVWFVLRATGRMLVPLCGNRPELRVDLEEVERTFAGKAIALAGQNEVHKNVLTQLGLWPYELLKTPREG